MPTYAYVCQACEHRLELYQSMSEAPKRKCPECGRLKLKRQIGTGAGIIFKGSGFYQTDYRSDSYKQGAEEAHKASESKSDEKKPPKDKKGAGKGAGNGAGNGTGTGTAKGDTS